MSTFDLLIQEFDGRKQPLVLWCMQWFFTHHNMVYDVKVVTMFMLNPKKTHLQVIK